MKRPKTDCAYSAGWMGIPRGDERERDRLARKPRMTSSSRNFPTPDHTAGPFVGCPKARWATAKWGTEHGRGRIVHMDITRIDLLIANKQLQNVPLFQQAMERGRTRHCICGLLSDGGVHSHIQHLFALLEMATAKSGKSVCALFMDGRDRRRTAGAIYVRQLQQKMRNGVSAEIRRFVGSYTAMDRDNRWERVELAYRALVQWGSGNADDDPIARCSGL